MKINNCSFYTRPILNNNNKTSQKQTSNVGFNYSLNEAIGRSQVKFTGNKAENEYDKLFIDNISEILNLSDNDKRKCKSIVNRYLEENNFSSIQSVMKSDDAEVYTNFTEAVGYGLNLSDDGFDKLTKGIMDHVLVDRIMEISEEDEDFARAAVSKGLNKLKDQEICDRLVENFGFDEEYTLSQLSRRHEDVKSEQIAYEFIEHYNLKLKDYKFIVETMNDVDENFVSEFLSQFCDE